MLYMKDYLLVLIYATWCGHCTTYKRVDNNGESEWSRVKKAIKDNFNDVDISEIESEQINPFSRLKDANIDKDTKKIKISSTDFNKKCKDIIKDKFEEFKIMLKSENTTKQELNDLIRTNKLLDTINIYELLMFRGYPTLMLMKNVNGIYEKYNLCNVPRNNGTAVCDFIKKCQTGKIESEKEIKLQEGGNKKNYRKKYKKYKKMYADLVEKYIVLKDKN